MRTSITKIATLTGVLAVSALAGANMMTAWSQTVGHQTQHPPLEVFCSHLSAGQLCLGGTPNVLKLEGAKKDQWLAAAGEYNKSVDASTKQLLAKAKAILSPEEYATVQHWFDHDLNEVMNAVLIGDQTKTGHK